MNATALRALAAECEAKAAALWKERERVQGLDVSTPDLFWQRETALSTLGAAHRQQLNLAHNYRFQAAQLDLYAVESEIEQRRAA